MTGRLSLLISLLSYFMFCSWSSSLTLNMLFDDFDLFTDCRINLSSLSRRFCIYYMMWSFGSSRVGTWYLYLVWRIYIVYVFCFNCFYSYFSVHFPYLSDPYWLYMFLVLGFMYFLWFSFILNLLFSISGNYPGGVIWPVHSNLVEFVVHLWGSSVLSSIL